MIKKDQNQNIVVEESKEKETKKSKTKTRRQRKSTEDKKLKQKIEELEIELKEAKDKYLRLFAEFDNYKKRTLKEKLEFMRTAAQETIVNVLPVLDDFDRAKKSADDENSKEYFSEGVLLVYNKLYQVLKNQGLEEMKSDGEEFDPELHEAISEILAPEKSLKQKIIDTIEKGYKLHDKIIRHAKVVVGK